MKGITTRGRLGIGTAALLAVAGGLYGLTRPAHTVHSASRPSSKPAVYVVTSCESVGAWCGDAQRAALKAQASIHPYLRYSCESVGAWCGDAQRSALKAHTVKLYVNTSCASVGAWCSDAQRAALAKQVANRSCESVGAWCGDAQRAALKRSTHTKTDR